METMFIIKILTTVLLGILLYRTLFTKSYTSLKLEERCVDKTTIEERMKDDYKDKLYEIEKDCEDKINFSTQLYCHKTYPYYDNLHMVYPFVPGGGGKRE